MTVRDQPAQAQVMRRGVQGAWGGRHSGPYDELLAARLADGMRRVLWLGDALEHLLRRLARRPRP
jgi:hypothetical protein